eukprot:gene22775-34898_t
MALRVFSARRPMAAAAAIFGGASVRRSACRPLLNVHQRQCFGSALHAHRAPLFAAAKQARGYKHLASASATAAAHKKRTRSHWQLFFRISRILWPKKGQPGAIRLKLQTTFAVGCVFATKFFGIVVPYWFKGIVDSLSTDPAIIAQAFNPLGTSVLGLVLAHSLFRTLQYLTQEARGALFATVVFDAMRNIGIDVARHLHRLPLSFHLGRQTGALSRNIDRGTKAVDRLLNFALFHIVPTALELVLVCGVLYYEAGAPFAITAFAAVSAYTVFTFVLSSWRITVRKKMNQAENEANVVIVDGLLNYETVKYFQNEEYEVRRYDVLLQKYSKQAVLTQQSLALLNFGQQFIFTAALGVAMALSAAQVAAGTMTLGDLVLINTLLMQLSVPLNFLGTVYRELQTAVTDMEALLALLEEAGGENLTNQPQEPFQFVKGDIEFQNVCFGYVDGKRMLDGVSFKVPGGTSLGVVGPSGCGKSTILRLLFRFFNPGSGSILLDGQDTRKLDQASFRKYFGVIPQDNVLFNDTVMHNIRYGNLDATDEECIAASKKAGLHSAVLTL